ncbi:MAG: hypothetical protein WCQ23_05405 [Candidatus Methanomethylophilaceae archaeon]|jgi:nitrogen regulatory protein PII
MESGDNIKLIVALLPKGHIEAVTESLSDITTGVVNVTGSADSGEKGLFGVSIKEETKMIFCLVKDEDKDQAFERIIENGELEDFPTGLCMSIPIDRIYRSPANKKVTGITDMPPKGE